MYYVCKVFCIYLADNTRDWWIGATDSTAEGRWSWPHSGKLAEWAAWAPNEPNGDIMENYAHISSDKDFKWKDDDNTNQFLPICQIYPEDELFMAFEEINKYLN